MICFVVMPPSRAIIAAVLLGFAACAQQPAPPTPPKPSLEFLGAWGTPGDGPGQLKSPAGLAVDSVGNVYVVDHQSKFVHKFNAKGTPLLSFQELRLRVPSGIAVDQGGAIYVADFSRGCVIVFFPDGARLRQVCGRGESRMADAMAVSVAEDGSIFVLDRGGDRIVKFNSRGRFQKAWGNRGDAAHQLANAFDLKIGADGFLYVADTDHHRVQKFTQEGDWAASWVVPPPTADPDRVRFLSAITVAGDHVLLANSLKRSVEVWTTDGRYKTSLDLTPWMKPGPPQIQGLALSTGGELFVLDPVGARVLRFHINF